MNIFTTRLNKAVGKILETVETIMTNKYSNVFLSL